MQGGNTITRQPSTTLGFVPQSGMKTGNPSGNHFWSFTNPCCFTRRSFHDLIASIPTFLTQTQNSNTGINILYTLYSTSIHILYIHYTHHHTSITHQSVYIKNLDPGLTGGLAAVGPAAAMIPKLLSELNVINVGCKPMIQCHRISSSTPKYVFFWNMFTPKSGGMVETCSNPRHKNGPLVGAFHMRSWMNGGIQQVGTMV